MKEGETDILILYDFTQLGGEKETFEDGFKLHTTSFNTIINTSILDFNSSNTIIIAALVYMTLILVMLIYSTRNAFKRTWYSYKNMVYVGMIIFLLVLIISLILQIGKYITSSNSYGRNKIEETADALRCVGCSLFVLSLMIINFSKIHTDCLKCRIIFAIIDIGKRN